MAKNGLKKDVRSAKSAREGANVYVIRGIIQAARLVCAALLQHISAPRKDDYSSSQHIWKWNEYTVLGRIKIRYAYSCERGWRK
eukprot:3494455-Prymnesium_polylepis.1